MKLIRMLKTMSGPNGTRSPGLKPFTVSDEEAAQLVAAQAAEIIADISATDIDDVLTPDIETATAEPDVEQAVTPKPRKRKK